MPASPAAKVVLGIALSLLGLACAGAGVYAVVRLANAERTGPAHCGPGFVVLAARCCAPGQTVSHGHCAGEPGACPPGMHLPPERSGCVIDERRVEIRGGKLSLSVEDWQSEGVVSPRSEVVPAFRMDAAEVTVERWSHCVRAGSCRPIDSSEPGLPVTAVDAKEAERFCRFASGRLPTSGEWLFAAFGADGRRFPWGPTGLVCRRAAYGLSDGPCGRGGGPELAGSHPDGATPNGILDLSGNVAEWTQEAEGRYVARGGSYRSASALEVSSWASEQPPKSARWVGFRCVYDSAGRAPMQVHGSSE